MSGTSLGWRGTSRFVEYRRPPCPATCGVSYNALLTTYLRRAILDCFQNATTTPPRQSRALSFQLGGSIRAGGLGYLPSQSASHFDSIHLIGLPWPDHLSRRAARKHPAKLGEAGRDRPSVPPFRSFQISATRDIARRAAKAPRWSPFRRLPSVFNSPQPEIAWQLKHWRPSANINGPFQGKVKL